MAEGYQLQHDEQGRPYYQFPGQPRNYVSPVAMGGQAPADETGMLRQGPQWNNRGGQWETPVDWGNLLTMGTGAALTGGALSAAGAFGGAAGGLSGGAAGAGGSGGALASSAVPGAAGGMLAGLPTATAGMSGAGGSMGLGGILGGVKKGLGFLGLDGRDVLGGLGAGLGAASQGQAQNRDAQLSAQLMLEKLLMDRDQNYFDNTLSREREGRASGQDAWRKLLSAQHFSQPSARPSVSPYSKPAGMRSEQASSGANQLMQEAMARLSGGNQLPMPEKRNIALDPNLMKPGGMEQTLGWLSPFLTGLGQQRPRPQVEPR